jgi:hypothetical protein
MASKLKRTRRGNAIGEELAKSNIENELTTIVNATSNEDLFKVDRIGSKNARKRIEKVKAVIVKNNGVESKADMELIKKKIKEVKSQESKKVVVSKIESSDLCDLWGEDNSIPSSNNRKLRNAPQGVKFSAKTIAEREALANNIKKNKLKIARPGQSYNPSKGDHQDALAEALALTLKKQEEVQKNSKLNTDMSDITKSLLKEDSEDSDSEIEDEKDDSSYKNKKSRKESRKMTRAERNKQARKSVATFEENRKNEVKDLNKQLDAIPQILKSIEEEDKYISQMKLLNKIKKEESLDFTSMTYDESGLVPLSDELNGTIRKIIPKGSAINGQVAQMRQNGDVAIRDRRKRRAYEAPHKQEKLVWVAKHKYV